jgi:hypothetical protein
MQHCAAVRVDAGVSSDYSAPSQVLDCCSCVVGAGVGWGGAGGRPTV